MKNLYSRLRKSAEHRRFKHQARKYSVSRKMFFGIFNDDSAGTFEIFLVVERFFRSVSNKK